MSLMTDTQGTPTRVWSLISLLRAHDGELSREDVKNWLDPFRTDTKGTAVQNTVGAATSLDLVEFNSSTGTLRLLPNDLPDAMSGFADWVHARLVATPPEHGNSVVLEAYAWFVARCAKEKGTNWIARENADSLTENIRVDLTPEGEEGRFNKTRYPRWRDWVAFMGLGIDLPTPRVQQFYPYMTSRLERELEDLRGRFGIGKEISADAFLEAIAQRMPYADNGELYRTAATRIRWAVPPRQLSIVLSNALRELDDDGALELRMRGDAPNAVTLHYDPTQRTNAFVSVVLNPTEAGDG